MQASSAGAVSAAATLASSPRRTLLQVGKFYPPHMGGIETHLQALCQELQRAMNVRVVVANDGPSSAEEELEDIPVSRLATPLTLFSTPICPALVRTIRSSNADLIHIHLPNPAAVAAYMASGHRGRVVFTYHSDTVRQRILGRLFEPLLHAALRRSSAIIATSPDYLRTSKVLAEHRNRCHVIPYGISLKKFERCDVSTVAGLRQCYGDRLVISVGRLVYYKGFEYLIRAMAKVNGKLLIIGNGPLRRTLEELARETGVAQKVIFAGEIQNGDVVPYYHAASVFALASVARSEAFGIVQIEAMASGIPVVNTRLDSGVPFVSVDGQTGLTVPPANPDALAKAINRLLDDNDLRVKFGRAARARANDEFNLHTMASRTLGLYESIMFEGPE